MTTELCTLSAVLLFAIFAVLVFYKNSSDIYLKRFIEYNSDIIAITNQTDILMMNSAGLNLYNFTSVSKLRQKTKYLSRLFKEIVEEDSKYIVGVNWVTKISKKQKITVQIELNNFKQTYTLQVHKINKNRYMVTFHNISRVVAERKAISQVAEKDELTKIYNRVKFNQMLTLAIRNATIYQKPFSLIILDIDHFKKVNDTYGHDIGDKVLIQVSALVKSMLHESDTFARWGGEEFVIIAEGATENGGHSLANRLREAIEYYPFEFVKQITCSFGVSQYKQGESAESVLKRADNALYYAKEGGRNMVSLASTQA